MVFFLRFSWSYSYIPQSLQYGRGEDYDSPGEDVSKMLLEPKERNLHFRDHDVLPWGCDEKSKFSFRTCFQPSKAGLGSMEASTQAHDSGIRHRRHRKSGGCGCVLRNVVICALADSGSLAGVVVLMLWFYLSAFIVLLGAELNSEIEHQIIEDTTTGRPLPMGERGAVKADTRPSRHLEKPHAG